MAKFADVCAGIRARKPILLPLPGAQIDSATGEWVAEEGKTVPLDIRALREDEYQDVLTFAMKWAKKHGLESPEDGDPLYERAKMIQTLALTCIDKDSPKNAPAPFFDGGFEQIRTSEIMTPEVIGYLYLQQQLWQDEISPLKKDMTPAEFLAAAVETAKGNMAFFVNSRPGALWNFTRTLASQLVSSLASSSQSSQSSTPREMTSDSESRSETKSPESEPTEEPSS